MTNSEISNLVSELTEKELFFLVCEICNQDKLCIPQLYNLDSAKYYGFNNLNQMNNVVAESSLHEIIDRDVHDLGYELSISE